MEPYLYPGDVVTFDDTSPADGDFAVVKIKGHRRLRVRQYHRINSLHFVLIPTQPEYPVLYSRDKVKILGRVSDVIAKD